MRNTEAREVQAVVDEVRRRIDLEIAELGDEFFPAHLSVALINAVLTPQLQYYEQVIPVIERYCRSFGVRRVRRDQSRLPPVEEQETTNDLIQHYLVLGIDGMQRLVFRTQYRSPGTKVLKSENVGRVAVALRGIGIQTLQDAQSTNPDVTKSVLKVLPGIGDRTIRMFLMYSGADQFVKGDTHVCRFVANALASVRVAPEAAERLVTLAAHALGITPRLVDYEIWKTGAVRSPGAISSSGARGTQSVMSRPV